MSKERKILLFLLLTAYSLLLIVCSSCSLQQNKIYRKTAILMDTLVAITAVSDSEEKAEKAIERAFAEIGRLDHMLNFFSSESELSMLNKHAAVSPVEVSPLMKEVIEKAVYASEKTDGAFDITIGPEISLWDFNKKIRPDDSSIEAKLPLVNYKWITLHKEKSTVTLKKGRMLIDLGAIAKGYAADRAVEELKKEGIKAGLVSVAGDIKAFGVKPDGKGWIIGIKNPRQQGKNDEIMATLELTDMAISTSGDYERFFLIDGKRYHHILDPRTGYPAQGCRSVSVIAKEGAYADSFSTGVFVLGPKKGMKVLEQMGLEGIIVDKDGRMETTPGLRGKVEFKRYD